MNEELENARKSALAFLKRHTTGVLATVGDEFGVHASTVHYAADDDFNIYFFTLRNTRKMAALMVHPQVAFTVSTESVPQTLQIEGMALDISLDVEATAKKDELMRVLNANKSFYPPPAKLDPSDAAIVWIRPTWVRWADYAFEESGSEHVFKEIPVS